MDVRRLACCAAATVIGGTTWAAWSPPPNGVPKHLGAASTAWRITQPGRLGNWTRPEQWRKSTRKCGRRTGMWRIPGTRLFVVYVLFNAESSGLWIVWNEIHMRHVFGFMFECDGIFGIILAASVDWSLQHFICECWNSESDLCSSGNFVVEFYLWLLYEFVTIFFYSL